MENIECQIHQSFSIRELAMGCVHGRSTQWRKTLGKITRQEFININGAQEKVRRRAAIIRTDTPMLSSVRTNCKFNRNYLNCNGTVCHSSVHTTISAFDCNEQSKSTNFDYSAFDAVCRDHRRTDARKHVNNVIPIGKLIFRCVCTAQRARWKIISRRAIYIFGRGHEVQCEMASPKQ